MLDDYMFIADYAEQLYDDGQRKHALLVLGNHNMYLTSQRLRKETAMPDAVLLSSDYIIVDEAHKLKEAAIEVFGNKLSEKDVPAFVKSVYIHCKKDGSHEFYHKMLSNLLNLNEELFAELKKEYRKQDHDDDQGTLMTLGQEQGLIIERMRQLVIEIEGRTYRCFSRFFWDFEYYR